MKKRGMSLVEVLVASAIIMTSVVSIIGAYGGLTKLSLDNMPRIQSAMLLEEGAEALRLMRDSGWTAHIAPLGENAPYRFVWSAGQWRATTSPALIDSKFSRTFTLAPVYRDATTYDIVQTGGTLDSGTKKATVSVSWNQKGVTTTQSIELYVYNTFNN
ncbi:MAG TPA: prepilin-type N-terminal cleavage/methylation domain-containing protein [Candidatus Paceibacterota bacterium]